MNRLLTGTCLFAAVAVSSLASISTAEAGGGFNRGSRLSPFPSIRLGGLPGSFTPIRRTSSRSSTRSSTRSCGTTRVRVTPVHPAPVHVAPVHVTPVQVAPVRVAPVEVAPVEVTPQPVADRDFELLQVLRRNPNLAAKHRDLCVRLNTKFARFLPASELIPLPAVVEVQQTVAPAAAVKESVVEPAPAVSPAPAAAAPAVTPAPAATPAPAVTTPAPAAATPAPATPAPAAPPVDLPPGIGGATPAAAPAAAPADLPGGLPGGSAAAEISPELKPLVGLWRSVSTKADGSQEITEVNLKQNGVAEVTIDSTVNGKTSLEGKVAVQDGNLNLLQAGDKSVTLGKVLLAQADKVQLQRGNETLTLTRP